MASCECCFAFLGAPAAHRGACLHCARILPVAVLEATAPPSPAGWRFTAVEHATHPRSFWGIQRAAVSSQRPQQRWPADFGGGGRGRGVLAEAEAEADRLLEGLLGALEAARGSGAGAAAAAAAGGGAQPARTDAGGPPDLDDIGWPGRWPPWGVRRRRFLLNPVFPSRRAAAAGGGGVVADTAAAGGTTTAAAAAEGGGGGGGEVSAAAGGGPTPNNDDSSTGAGGQG